ncbi:MAG: ABC transporter ATP-binding protein [Lachnospiraceae bacterium]|nr:MAG: ABC transporter ATP-binding protein [Lachnospiraceae bacterium]
MKQTVKRLIKDLFEFKWHIIFILVCAILIVLSNLFIPLYIGRAIDCIKLKESVDFTNLYKNLIYIFIAIVIYGISQFALNRLNQVINCEVARNLRNKMFDKLQRLDFTYIDANPKGTILSHIINDVDILTEGLYMMFLQFITGSLTIILTIAFMFYINPVITLIVIFLTPLSMLVARFVSKKSFSAFVTQANKRDKILSMTRENIYGMSSIYLFNKENYKYEQFISADEELRKSSLDAIFFSSVPNPSTRAINAFIYALISIVGAFLVISGNISIGNLTSFLTYAQQYSKPFNEISGVITELQNALVCAKRVYEFLDEKEFEKDNEDSKEVDDISGDIKLEAVAFSYDKSKDFIKDMNLSIKSGMKVALVGPTGCGKSTLINLLMRFYETDTGAILVDNYNIKSIKRNSLLSSYGMVLQDTWLKSGSIRENIAFGKKDASLEEIEKVCRQCMADSFIRRLPKAYDSEVDKGAENLSIGQKQLLCIARVMLSNPPVLILDEATSSIDARTELKVKRALDKMMEGKTSFIVAHRLSTIKEADIILVMKDGHIIERGNHEELIKQNGFYKELYNSQYVG